MTVPLSASIAIGGDADGDQLSGIENLVGSSLGDVLRGDGSQNTMDGGAGSDVLSGEGGSDVLYGGAGCDFISGDAGKDDLYGNGGDDTFCIFATSQIDTIRDFSLIGDSLLFHQTGATQWSDLPRSQVGAGVHVTQSGGSFTVIVENVTVAQLDAVSGGFAFL